MQHITWTCHVCGAERPDDRISTAQHLHVNGAGVEMKVNVRYCNDNEECFKEAQVSDLWKLEWDRQRRALEERVDGLGSRWVRVSLLGTTAGFFLGLFASVVIL
jgi:hypothetical protein